MPVKIKYKESFVDRLERQLIYIAADNPRAAQKLKKDIVGKLKAMALHPHSCRKSIFFDDNTIRDLVFKGYTVVFRITETHIEVFGFVKHQQNVVD